MPKRPYPKNTKRRGTPRRASGPNKNPDKKTTRKDTGCSISRIPSMKSRTFTINVKKEIEFATLQWVSGTPTTGSSGLQYATYFQPTGTNGLMNAADWASYSGIYDRFRISSVTVKYIPQETVLENLTPSNQNIAQQEIIMLVDYTDYSTQPYVVLQGYARKNAIRFNILQTRAIQFTPSVQNLLLTASTGVYNQQPMGSPWMTTGNTNYSVLYGLKMASSPTATSLTAGAIVFQAKLEITTVFQFTDQK